MVFVVIPLSVHPSRYQQSLSVLNHAKICKEGMITKSSIMLGLGELDEEVKETMADLRAIGVDILTLGQYLQVSHYNVYCRTFVLDFLHWGILFSLLHCAL